MESRTSPLYRLIASACGARKRCISSNNSEWETRWGDLLDRCEDLLPSGSGIDSGSKIDRELSGDDRIVITTAFHHMNDNGMYDGWTEHVVTIKPAFDGISVTISGRNRNEIKDYLAECFDYCLRQLVTETADDLRPAQV